MAASIGLPASLYSKSKGSTVQTAEALAGADYIGLYFSAHWCPPCRQFTPVLSDWVTRNAANKKFTVIFASNDKDEKEMKGYLGEMSWDLALPYGDASTSKLGQKYKVEGIPTLVILDAKTGALVTNDGRRGISEDKSGAAFPYRPPTVEDILGAVPALTDKSGASIPVADVTKNTYLALYFSAHWCPPCRGFTPKAADWYTAFRSSGKPFSSDFDVVFVSSDKDEASFKQYLSEMPWKAIPLSHKDAKAKLSGLFKVQGIPTMVLLKKGADGVYELVTDQLRSKIESDPDNFPWPPKALESIDAAAESINDLPTLITFVDKLTDAAAEDTVSKAVEEVAQAYFTNGAPSDALRFALAREEDDASEAVRQFVRGGMDKDGPTSVRITIVDVKNQGKANLAIPAGTLPTSAQIKAFADDFVAGKLQLTKFKE